MCAENSRCLLTQASKCILRLRFCVGLCSEEMNGILATSMCESQIFVMSECEGEMTVTGDLFSKIQCNGTKRLATVSFAAHNAIIGSQHGLLICHAYK